MSADILERSSPLDALRGILATSVVFHHFFITYQWKVSGAWIRPQSDILNNMGGVPVSLFFMITGFLFFGKVYKKSPDFLMILKSRIFRVFPLYVFLVFLVFLISFAEAGFFLVDGGKLIKELSKWALFKGGALNGFSDAKLVVAGVPWTLRYEWFFYLSLPILAVAVNGKTSGWYLLGSVLMVFMLFSGLKLELLFLFSFGFAPVVIKREFPSVFGVVRGGFFACACMVLVFFAMMLETYSVVQMIVLGVAFLIVSLGNDVFGVLRSSGLKFLGEISYSIYLLHGLVLYVMFSMADVFDFERWSLLAYEALFPGVLLIVVLVSLCTYRVIEKPFMGGK